MQSNTDDAASRGESAPLSEELGPLPEPALTVVKNRSTQEIWVSDHGTAYYGSNWYAHQRCYSEEQMRAHAAQEVAAERERCAKLCETVDLTALNEHPGWMIYTGRLCAGLAALIRGA